ncbi:MAG TPA: septal ring lytic transglycosylase RlpA family protein [Chthoniobacterales bacterium]|nr:septal ring lytic transglycosylase RlpA family protein [Chthoniobacterales bacterium]
MPTRPADGCVGVFTPRGPVLARVWIVLIAIVWSFLSAEGIDAASRKTSLAAQDSAKTRDLEGYATWYPVPRHSRTKSRAEVGELTAAHRRLPFGTRVRVTHLGNHKTVDVCIIDRLVGRRIAVIDLCKEAAEQLGMVSEGRARVRLEVLPDRKISAQR